MEASIVNCIIKCHKMKGPLRCRDTKNQCAVYKANCYVISFSRHRATPPAM